MDKFTLTCYNLNKSGYSYNTDENLYGDRVWKIKELTNFLRRYAGKHNMNGDLKIDTGNPIPHILKITVYELSFLLVILRELGNYIKGYCEDKERDKYYVLGNSTYAFSNRKTLEYYASEEAKAASTAAGLIRDISNSESPVVSIQHYSIYDLLELVKAGKLEPSHLWSPFEEPEFFDAETLDSWSLDIQKDRRSKFKKLRNARIEAKKVYAEKLLDIIKHHMEIFETFDIIKCIGHDGMPVLVDPSAIAAVKPVSDAQDMMVASLVIPKETNIRVDLRSFVKELGYVLPPYNLPVSLIEQPIAYTSAQLRQAYNLSEEIWKDYQSHT